MQRRTRRTRLDIDALKNKFKETCCFKDTPIPTKDVYEMMGFNYSDVNQRQQLYRYIHIWVAESINELNFKIPSELPLEAKKIIYKRFLEKCWLEKKPFGFFNHGVFYTPKEFEQYEALLNRYTIALLFGFFTKLEEMSDRGMKLNGKVFAESVLDTVDTIVKRLEISEEDLNEIKKLGLEREQYIGDLLEKQDSQDEDLEE